MKNEEIIKQLLFFYFEEETWHEKRLSRIEAWKYHEDKINRGELITISDGELLVGYVEFSINNGCCFVNNLFIRQGYRNKRAIWMLKKRLFEVAKNCKIFLGERNKLNMRYPEVQIRSHNGR